MKARGFEDNVFKNHKKLKEKKFILVKTEKYPSHVEERCTEVGPKAIFPELIV